MDDWSLAPPKKQGSATTRDLRVPHFVVIMSRRREKSLNDRNCGQTIPAHVDDHVDDEVETKQEVKDRDDNDAGDEVPSGDVQSHDVLENEVDVDPDDEAGQRHREYLG